MNSTIIITLLSQHNGVCSYGRASQLLCDYDCINQVGYWKQFNEFPVGTLKLVRKPKDGSNDVFMCIEALQ
jgi:hypothetical protein